MKKTTTDTTESVEVGTSTANKWFFPEQDGKPAMCIEAETIEEATEIYISK